MIKCCFVFWTQRMVELNILLPICLIVGPIVAFLTIEPTDDDYFGWLVDRTNILLTQVTISQALALSPSHLPAVLLTIASLLLLLNGIAREIQIRVIFDRFNAYTTWSKRVNVFNVFLMIAAAIGFELIIVFPLNSVGTIGDTFHNTGTAIAFVASLGYHLIHIVLTFQQRKLEFSKKYIDFG